MSDQAVMIPRPYPLAWPPGKARTPAHTRERGHYSLRTLAQAMTTMQTEVDRWQRLDKNRRARERIINWEVTTNHPGGRSAPALDDPGAAVYFTIAGGPITGPAELRVLASDRFLELPQNVRALSLTLERLRLVAEVGAYSLVAAVEGAKMLPPPVPRERPWREVLGIAGDATLRVVEAVYRAMAAEAGEGSPRLTELNLAIAAARRELG